jgi:hypothetical protein
VSAPWKRTENGEYLSEDYRLAPGENSSGKPVYWYVFLKGTYVTGKRTLRDAKAVVESKRSRGA